MTVGEALAEARYRAGLTLDEVSERSRIREAVIRSIEQDDYDACGGELYVRGYVRAIAGAIGIDAQPLIREYDEGRANATAGAGSQGTAPSQAAAADAAPAAADLAVTSANHAAVTRADLAALPTMDRAVIPLEPVPAAPRETSTWRVRIHSRRWATGLAVLLVMVLGAAGFAGSQIVAGLRHTPAKDAATAVAQAGTRKAGNGGTAAGTKVAALAGTPSATAKATPAPSKAPGKAKAAAAATAGPVRALHVAFAVAYGPEGVADGDNPQSALFPITPGAPLPWRTDWYATPEFGLLRHGTGLLLDMGRTVTITSVRIDLGPYRGAALELLAGGAPDMARLRVAARGSDLGGTVRLRLPSAVRARYLLIWFTLLPPNGTGSYQASVYRVEVNGRP